MENRKERFIDIHQIIARDVDVDKFVDYISRTDKGDSEYMKVEEMEDLPFGYTNTEDSWMYTFEELNLSIDKEDGRMRLTGNRTGSGDELLKTWLIGRIQQGAVSAKTGTEEVKLHHHEHHEHHDRENDHHQDYRN